MCGIAGILEFNRPPTAPARAETAHDVRKMMALLRHRGPDGGGLFQRGGITLGHRRLSIIDSDSGWQPLQDASGRLTLVFNGEIYNAPELRRDLLARGHRFQTRTDTEVLLYMYLEHGPQCLERLNGMFAFAIWDQHEQQLFMARDRFGIKPLYCARLSDRLLFASEAKALLPLLPAVETDPAALQDYFKFQLCLEERTFFRGVERLLPSQWRIVKRDGTVRDERYWDLDFTIDPSLTEAHVTSRVGWLLEDSVRLNLWGDVPVGAYLSGGLDSSSVVMMANEVLGIPLPCFAGGFREGPLFDETPFARQVARAAGAELFERFPGPADFEAVIGEVTYALDEPMAGPGAFPQYLVAEMASRHVKVILGGQGGDEVFGGYARYLIAYLEECLRGAIFDTQKGVPFVVTFESILPNLPLLQPYVPLLRQFWSEGLFGPVDQRYLKLIQKFSSVGRYLTPSFRALLAGGEPGTPMLRDFNRPELGSLINKMSYVDIRHFLPALLQVEDRMSMAWSLESRVPLLDHRLVELVARTPPTIKFAGGELKTLLKRAVAHLVPREVIERRDKMGFPVPLNLWASGPLQGFLRETLLGEAARSRGLYEPQAIERAIQGAEGFDRDLWGLLAVELWHQVYVDRGRERWPDEAGVEQVRNEEREGLRANPG